MSSQDVAPLPVDQEWNLPSHRKVAMILIILTETALFTIFVIAYLFYNGKSLGPPYPREVLELPILGTIFLLSSSGTIIMAERKLHEASLRGFHLWWFITFALGAAFLVYTALEWHKLIYLDGLTIATNLFGSTYYSLVGLHASHVVVGLFLIALILIMSLRGKVLARHREHIEMISWYWHFVDAVWVIVFTVVYVIGAKA